MSVATLVTAKQVGEKLSLAEETVHAWARAKKIPSKRLSRKAVRFDMAEVLKALGVQNSG